MRKLRLRLVRGSPEALAQTLADHPWASINAIDGEDLLLTLDEDRRGELIDLAQTHGGLRELIEERREETMEILSSWLDDDRERA